MNLELRKMELVKKLREEGHDQDYIEAVLNRMDQDTEEQNFVRATEKCKQRISGERPPPAILNHLGKPFA